GGQGAAVIDRELAILGAPCADGVVIFQSEAERVHALMTRSADGLRAVHLHALAERALQLSLVLGQFTGVRRWRRRRRAQDILQNPFATLDRRGPGWIAGHRQDAGLSDDSAALFPGQLGPLKLLALDAGNAIMFGEHIVDKGEIAVDKVENAAV